MRRLVRNILPLLIVLAVCQPAPAQFRDIFKKSKEKLQKASDTFTPWSAEQEREIGEAAAAKLIHIFGMYEEPVTMKYVNLVGNAVALHGSRGIPYHFAVLDTEAISAFGMPGGYVFITRGALANMTSEAQLAGTLAHEIAHVDNRHLEREVRSKKARQWAFQEGSSHIGVEELKQVADSLVNEALTMQVSRDKEDEADRKGTELAANTGYQPAGLRDFLQLLAQVSAAGKGQQQLGLWGSTHPPFEKRVQTLTRILESYPSGGEQLASRFQASVRFGASNDQLVAKPSEKPAGSVGAPAASKAAAKEVEGVVSQGVILPLNGELQEGARVKVVAGAKQFDGVVRKNAVVVTGGKLTEGQRVKLQVQ